MPIPIPQPNESEAEFMRRCMADPVMVDEYEDNGQRFAVCQAAMGMSDAEDYQED